MGRVGGGSADTSCLATMIQGCSCLSEDVVVYTHSVGYCKNK